MSPTWSSQCFWLIHQRAFHVLPCLCDIACKGSLAICCKSTGHCVPLAGFCLSLNGLHVLNREVNMIQTNKNKTHKPKLPHESSKTWCVCTMQGCRCAKNSKGINFQKKYFLFCVDTHDIVTEMCTLLEMKHYYQCYIHGVR